MSSLRPPLKDWRIRFIISAVSADALVAEKQGSSVATIAGFPRARE